MDAERSRLADASTKDIPWRKWGPYLSERQWSTVREDTSAGENAWESLTHDPSRSRATVECPTGSGRRLNLHSIAPFGVARETEAPAGAAVS